MQTGWFYDGGSWYYLLPSGKMVADDAQTINGVGYAFDSSGRMLANTSFALGSSPAASYVVYFDANGS
jgi:glucan-binding YG repeat protein